MQHLDKIDCIAILAASEALKVIIAIHLEAGVLIVMVWKWADPHAVSQLNALVFHQGGQVNIFDLPDKIRSDIEAIANAIVACRKSDKPVVLFTGAHLIKNGLGPLLADLVNRRLVSLVAGNCAEKFHLLHCISHTHFTLPFSGSRRIPGSMHKSVKK